ncbi:MAG: hypothetical protein QGI86_26410 [Candidatus Poribacteria bacterium]|nr:hypothetical protein [Candidatus Poribacteria bacterium]MDP6750648.1 hypothetical protein [Candidatus Poribacteria bacterium]MDP6961263.1 hypothetical protein [Dehalococcoidia bacterium]
MDTTKFSKTAPSGAVTIQADTLAKRIADYCCHKVHIFTNAHGGFVQVTPLVGRLSNLDVQVSPNDAWHGHWFTDQQSGI